MDTPANATDAAKSLQEECGKAIWIGRQPLFAPLHLNGQYFTFTAQQQMFLYGLKKHQGDVDKAAMSAGWTRDQAERFFTTRKWRQYKEMLLAKAATRNGDLVDFWWDFMFDGARGFQERYEGQCEMCHQEYRITTAMASQYQDDNLKMNFNCQICQTAVPLQYVQKEFKPSREQVQCASEIGQRVEPKRERVHHTISEETYVFTTAEDPA